MKYLVDANMQSEAAKPRPSVRRWYGRLGPPHRRLVQNGPNAGRDCRRPRPLTLAQVYGALAYYHANHQAIDAELTQEEFEYDRLAGMHVADKAGA